MTDAKSAASTGHRQVMAKEDFPQRENDWKIDGGMLGYGTDYLTAEGTIALAIMPCSILKIRSFKPMATLKINGKQVEVDADRSTPLLWVLREQLGLTGTKYGCGIGLCGSCTVHIDGRAVRSCTLPLSAVTESQEITTIEGLSADGSHPLQQAWEELDVPQCGYCQPGMIMSAAALLDRNPEPDDADIDANITNICRCGTYNRVRRGIHLAVEIGKRGRSK
ncbi:MAG: (2Fe-2S)-binding protein [Oceanisphaera sp.]|nr:(2Fe-2S)-binding protein [Oceanisphaera sp.]